LKISKNSQKSQIRISEFWSIIFASVSPVYCKKIRLDFAPMAILAVALLQQHDARQDILTEPAARRRAAIEARGNSELGAFGTGGAIGP